MRILFIYPSWTGEYGLISHFAKRAGVYPPLNLALLAAISEEHGYESAIIDAEADSIPMVKLVKEATQLKPDVVAITGKSPFFHLSVQFAEQFKALNPDIPICIGGAHITIQEEKAFFPCFDYGFTGECEESWPAFLDCVKNKKDVSTVPGLLYRRDKTVHYTGKSHYKRNLDALPFPARHLLPMKKYIMGTIEGRKNFTSIQTMRGCPWKCIFCASEKLNTTQVDKRSPESVATEIEHVIHTFGIHHFIILDDVLTLERPHILKICDLILERNLKITFDGNTRAHLLDEPLIARMREAGLLRLSLGLESVNKQMRETMKKKVPLEYYSKANEWLRKHGVEALNSVMIGLPGETRETVQETLDFLRKERNVMQANLAVAIPYPGTEFYDIAKSGRMGMQLKNEDFSQYRRYGTAVTQVGTLTPQDLIELQNDGFVAIYSAPWRWVPMLKKHGPIGGALMLLRVFRLLVRKALKVRMQSPQPLFNHRPGLHAPG